MKIGLLEIFLGLVVCLIFFAVAEYLAAKIVDRYLGSFITLGRSFWLDLLLGSAGIGISFGVYSGPKDIMGFTVLVVGCQRRYC